jgi:hypothetical protein
VVVFAVRDRGRSVDVLLLISRLLSWDHAVSAVKYLVSLNANLAVYIDALKIGLNVSSPYSCCPSFPLETC